MVGCNHPERDVNINQGIRVLCVCCLFEPGPSEVEIV